MSRAKANISSVRSCCPEASSTAASRWVSPLQRRAFSNMDTMSGRSSLCASAYAIVSRISASEINSSACSDFISYIIFISNRSTATFLPHVPDCLRDRMRCGSLFFSNPAPDGATLRLPRSLRTLYGRKYCIAPSRPKGTS